MPPPWSPPPGRFLIVAGASARHPAVVVDYAHTPESVGSALAAARDLYPRGRLHAVFGCGGDCYKAKRPLMGAIAARAADAITVTSDNPRTRGPAGHRPGHLAGRPDRPAAGRPRRARPGAGDRAGRRRGRGGDVVVLLGKGAERTQEVDGRTYPFSDARVARQALARRARR